MLGWVAADGGVVGGNEAKLQGVHQPRQGVPSGQVKLMAVSLLAAGEDFCVDP